jgi:hypothetical protein
MSNTVTVSLEAGIAYPSRFIPVFCWGHVDHLFFTTNANARDLNGKFNHLRKEK